MVAQTCHDYCASVNKRVTTTAIVFLTLLSWYRYAREVSTVLVSKCFTGRPKTIAKATEAIELFVELEASEAVVVSKFCYIPQMKNWLQ